jgi:hypothetical protein
MPSSTSVGSPDQRVRRRVTVTLVAVLAVFAGVVPLATPVVAETGGAAPEARGAPGLPHGNTTDGNLTLYVGPAASYDALDEFGDLTTAHRTGAVDGAVAEVDVGETLIVSLTSRRLGAEYADTTGPNASVRFFEALDGTGANLTLRSPADPGCEPTRIDLRASRHRVLANGSTGAFRLLLDTGALAHSGGCDGELDIPGRYEVTAALPARDGTRRATDGFYLEGSADDPDPSPSREIDDRRGAPPLAGDLRSVAAIRRAARTERLVPTSHVVHGEVAVLEVRSPRLTRAYANVTGENATVRLLRAVNATDGRFGFDPRTAPTGPEPTQSPESRGLVLPGPGIRTVPDRANDTVYLVLDTGRARLRTGDGVTALSNSTVEELRPTLVVDGADRERYETRLRVTEPAGSFGIARNRSVSGDRSLAVVGTDGEFVVRPGTNLAPGSRVTVRVRDGNETLARRGVRLGDGSLSPPEGAEGVGALAFDLGTQPAGRALNVTLARNGTELHRGTVLVGSQPVLRDATARRVRSGPEETTVRFAVTADYPAPGYVVVQNASGRYVGFEVPAGEPVRVTGTVTRRRPGGELTPEFRLIAVYDANRNGVFDGPRGRGYNDPAFPSSGAGALIRSVELPPPSPTPTVTAPPPGTTLAVEEGQPGFGVLVLLGALGAVVLLARRR